MGYPALPVTERGGRRASRRLALSLIFLVCGASFVPAQPATDLRGLSRTLETLSETVRPALVQVFATGYAVGEGMVPLTAALLSRERGSGSGVIVDPEGYVVTNAHVVANASRIQVELLLSDRDTVGLRSVVQPRGELVAAQVVGVDRETDLAVLKLRVDRALTALPLGDSEALRPGELVMAFGSPLGLANSVSLRDRERGRASDTSR